MTAALSYARFELVRSLRDTRFTFFLIAMPGLLYVLYSGFATNAGESGLSGPAARMVALACYAAMGGALYSIGPPLAAERASGWIRQLRITPLPGPSWLSAKMLHAAAMTVPGVIVVGVLGVALEDVHASGTHWAIATAILVAGSLPFALIGLVIGQALEGQASVPDPHQLPRRDLHPEQHTAPTSPAARPGLPLDPPGGAGPTRTGRHRGATLRHRRPRRVGARGRGGRARAAPA